MAPAGGFVLFVVCGNGDCQPPSPECISNPGFTVAGFISAKGLTPPVDLIAGGRYCSAQTVRHQATRLDAFPPDLHIAVVPLCQPDILICPGCLDPDRTANLIRDYIVVRSFQSRDSRLVSHGFIKRRRWYRRHNPHEVIIRAIGGHTARSALNRANRRSPIGARLHFKAAVETLAAVASRQPLPQPPFCPVAYVCSARSSFRRCRQQDPRRTPCNRRTPAESRMQARRTRQDFSRPAGIATQALNPGGFCRRVSPHLGGDFPCTLPAGTTPAV